HCLRRPRRRRWKWRRRARTGPRASRQQAYKSVAGDWPALKGAPRHATPGIGAVSGKPWSSPFANGLLDGASDNAAGAQTERRGGAGPAGACVAGRAPRAVLVFAHLVDRGPRRITAGPFCFLGEAGLLTSSSPSREPL